MGRLLLALIGVLATACGAVSAALAEDAVCQSQRGKIVGGATAKLSDWPGQAVLRVSSEAGHVAYYVCGGTAISDRWVLTAAHCLPDFISKLSMPVKGSDGKMYEGRLEVVLGAQDLRGVTVDQVYPVDQVVMHENYRVAAERTLTIPSAEERGLARDKLVETTGDDVGLIRMARPWQGPRAVLSLGSATDVPPNYQVRAAGFGKTRYWSGLSKFKSLNRSGDLYAGSPELLETGIETIGQEQCAKRYPNGRIGAGQICAGVEQGGKDSCTGDSGGPLVAAGKNGCPRQIGIVSWGYGCGSKDDGGTYYGVYTRISAYADWIQKHTGPLSGAEPAENLTTSGELSEPQLAEAMRQLGTLLRAPALGKVTVGVPGGNVVKIGAKYVFDVRAAVEGRLVILDVDPNRKVTLIYPNKFVTGNDLGRVRAGEQVRVPGPNYPGFTAFQATEPPGKEKLLAFVVPEDFPIDRSVASAAYIGKSFVPVNDPPSYLMRFLAQIETKLSPDSHGSEELSKELQRWGFSVTDLEFVH